MLQKLLPKTLQKARRLALFLLILVYSEGEGAAGGSEENAEDSSHSSDSGDSEDSVDSVDRKQSPSLADMDRKSLRKYLEGNEEGFLEFFDRHQRRVFRIAYSFVREQDSAEDLTQDIFLRFLDKIDKYNFRYAPSTFLYRMAKNLCINHIESAAYRKKASVEQEYLEQLGDTAGSVDDTLYVRRIRECIESAAEELPPRVKAVFSMRQEEALPYDVIAENLDISLRSAKRYMKRALLHIGRHLERAGLKPDSQGRDRESEETST